MRPDQEDLLAVWGHSPHGIVISTPEGDIVAANPPACRILGRTEAQIKALGRRGLVDESNPEWQAALDRARLGFWLSVQLPARRPDGTTFWLEISSGRYFRDDGSEWAVVMLYDVDLHNRQHAAAAAMLIDSPEDKREPVPYSLDLSDFSAIYSETQDAVMFTNADGLILAANPAACQLLRLSEHDLCEMWREDFRDPNAEELWEDALEQRERAKHARALLPVVRGDGSTFVADATSTVFMHHGERRACVVFRDSGELRQGKEREETIEDFGLSALRDAHRRETMPPSA